MTVKILEQNEERALKEYLREEKVKEVAGLKKRNIWTPVKESDIEKGDKILGEVLFCPCKIMAHRRR